MLRGLPVTAGQTIEDQQNAPLGRPVPARPNPESKETGNQASPTDGWSPMLMPGSRLPKEATHKGPTTLLAQRPSPVQRFSTVSPYPSRPPRLDPFPLGRISDDNPVVLLGSSLGFQAGEGRDEPNDQVLPVVRDTNGEVKGDCRFVNVLKDVCKLDQLSHASRLPWHFCNRL
jgi:hypothetical protein